MHACHVASPQMAHLWLSVKAVSGYTVLFGSRIINCSQEEVFGNLLSRLAEWVYHSVPQGRPLRARLGVSTLLTLFAWLRSCSVFTAVWCGIHS